MKVFLTKDVEKVGFAGEMLNVADGFAANYLLPRKLAVTVTAENEHLFQKQIKTIENRKEAVSTATSMLAEKIKALKLTLKKKVQENGKLYGSISPVEIVDLLAAQGVSISKNQVIFDKSIKEKGSYDIVIKLSSRLQPTLSLKVINE